MACELFSLISPHCTNSTYAKVDHNELNIERLLGSGGFGSVYEGTYGSKKVAIKKLHQRGKNERAALDSFKAEVLAMSLLHHPNIVETVAISTASDCLHDYPLLIMELAGSRNLQEVLNDTDTEVIDVKRRLKFAHQIAMALEYTHSFGIVHLDLKPANVLITPEDNCKLADFGCSQTVQEDGSCVNSPTRSYLTGTFAYTAPELLRGCDPTTKADIYSFAICLWQLIARERPYGCENPHVVIFAVVAYNHRPPITTQMEMEEDYQHLVMQGWNACPSDRPTAADCVEVLKKLQQ
ncbi:Serine/threonine-protein kinase mos [Trichoplax sp. H2]|nr:Serine/threonine-protein kinase mos [Trichoplax sp. H2]|eukprot:RDD47748.1 Serine/threonine-protein kinase mos [Trichoplax sp. H2]